MTSWPDGKYSVVMELVCDDGSCQLDAVVSVGKLRGTHFVVESFQDSDHEEYQAMRDQCLRTLRIKWGEDMSLDRYMKHRDGSNPAWVRDFFVEGALQRDALHDDYLHWVEVTTPK